MIKGGRMDMRSRKQYLKDVQKEYLRVNKSEKIKLLDEAEKRTGLNRKYLIRKLSPKTRWDKIPNKRRRSKEYSSSLIAPLVCLWDIFDEPCGQRLVSSIKDELDRLRDFGEIWVTDQEANQLKKMSAKTIDRLLNHEKSVRLIEEKYQRNKNPLLYQKIPTKLSDEFDRSITGQIQIDGVEHCGVSASGEYLVTVSHTDVASGWWEGLAVIGKGKTRTLEAIKDSRKRFPFNWVEIHPDNGTSFINYFLYDYATSEGLEFSRSRPFKKNDNCFVEQKNSRNVRRHVGNVRYDRQKELKILNNIYQNELRLYKNFFQPIMRLELKERNKGHIHRKYQEAKTPYQWLIDNPNISNEIKTKLKKQHKELNPAKLKRDIETKLQLLMLTYKNKQNHHQNYNEFPEPKVTFLFDPTTELRLPSYLT